MSNQRVRLAAFIAAAGLLLGAGAAYSAGPSKTAVTFTKDVAPILYENCVSCHRPGEVAPMSFMTYQDVRPWARSIRENVVNRVMPPWLADPKMTHFANDPRLSQKEIDTIKTWVDAGAPKGADKDLPPAPKFTEGWMIGEPDLVLSMPEEYEVPADGTVPYLYFTVPTNFTEDRWVSAVEFRPGNRSVVHHIIGFIQEPGTTFRGEGNVSNLLGGTAPGEAPNVYPAGTAKLIKAGSSIVFQMHYTPNGTAAKDRSKIGMIFAKPPVKHSVATGAALNFSFAIPPGHPNFEVKSSWEAKEDVHLLGLMPHMHVRGKDFTYTLVYPDGRSEVILHVPRYDFNWQLSYDFKKPIPLPKGTRIECVAHFDNSSENVFNPDPSKEVRWGDQTWEEMMIGWFTYTRDEEKIPAVSTASIKE